MAHETPFHDARCKRFRKIAGLSGANTLIIVVPGIGTPQPGEWIDNKGQLWLQHVRDDTDHGAAVFVYENRQIPSDNFSWQSLIDVGNDFSVDLLEQTETEKLFNCPLILVSHSLGGIIVKQGLCKAAERSFHFKKFFKAIAGFVFFGTPHSISGDAEEWQNALYATSLLGHVKKKDRVAQDDAQLLGNLSLRFEQTMASVPVLGFYETQPTKIQIRYSIVSSHKLILMSKNSVCTNMTSEDLIGLGVDHWRLCNLQVSGQEHEKICSFVRISAGNARSCIQRGLPEYAAPSALDSLTVRSRGSRDSLFKENDVSGSGNDRPRCEKNQSSSTHDTQRATANSSESAGFEIIPGVSNFSTSKKGDPKLPCHIIPFSRNDDFLSQTEALLDIDNVFFNLTQDTTDAFRSQNELRAFAICGPGGIGKTQTALEYVLSRKDRFDAIFWVRADQSEKLSDDFSNIARTMRLVPENSVDAKDQVLTQEAVKGWLADPLKSYQDREKKKPELARWLLVFDNVDDPELLTDFWPPDAPGCVIVTSRDPLAKKNGFSSMSGIDLKPFTEDQGAELLLKLTGRSSQPAGDSSVSSVVKRLGGFPLALTQMAGVITRQDLTFAEFLRTYDEEESRVELINHRLEHPSRRTGYEHTLASVWAIESLRDGAVLLDLLSILDPDGAQEKIFTQTPRVVTLKGFPKTSAAYQKARADLFRSSLVTRDATGEKLMIHRLVQDTARTKMTQKHFTATFSAAVSLLCSVWPFDDSTWQHGVARWKVCEELFPHILRLRCFSTRFTLIDNEHLAKFQLARILNDAGWYQLERGHPAESEIFYQVAKTLCLSLKADTMSSTIMYSEKVSIMDKVNDLLAEVFHHNGCAASTTNQSTKALSNFQEYHVIASVEAKKGGEARDKAHAISWNELGVAYMMNQRWLEGQDCFQRSIDLAKKLPNFNKTMISFAMVNLGLAYWLTNRLEQSLQVLDEGLGDRQAAFGADDRVSFVTGRFLHAIGNVKASQGLVDESFVYHQRALIQFKDSVGNNHHRTAALCYKVAEHQVRLQMYTEAEELLEQVLKIYGDRTEYTPEKARVWFLKSKLLLYLAPEKAQDALEQSYRLYHSVIGKVRVIKGDPDASAFQDIIVFWSK